MPTDITTSRAFVRERTEKTRAVQSTLAADSGWTWPTKTLAAWDADLVSMDATVNNEQLAYPDRPVTKWMSLG